MLVTLLVSLLQHPSPFFTLLHGCFNLYCVFMLFKTPSLFAVYLLQLNFSSSMKYIYHNISLFDLLTALCFRFTVNINITVLFEFHNGSPIYEFHHTYTTLRFSGKNVIVNYCEIVFDLLTALWFTFTVNVSISVL